VHAAPVPGGSVEQVPLIPGGRGTSSVGKPPIVKFAGPLGRLVSTRRRWPLTGSTGRLRGSTPRQQLDPASEAKATRTVFTAAGNSRPKPLLACRAESRGAASAAEPLAGCSHRGRKSRLAPDPPPDEPPPQPLVSRMHASKATVTPQNPSRCRRAVPERRDSHGTRPSRNERDRESWIGTRLRTGPTSALDTIETRRSRRFSGAVMSP
jgi:hypothetical protein